MASKTELAKAYVQITPSADGIGSKIRDMIRDELGDTGETAGQSLGKSLIGAVGKILAAAGIGKMLQAAFTEGSAFETEVAKVGTIADTTKVPIGELKEQITDLSGTMGIAAGDLAEATYQAISAGQDTGDAAVSYTHLQAEGHGRRVRHLPWQAGADPLRRAFRCRASAVLCH